MYFTNFQAIVIVIEFCEANVIVIVIDIVK